MFSYQQVNVHVTSLSQSEQAVRDELTRARGLAAQEQMRTSTELAREIAERAGSRRNLMIPLRPTSVDKMLTKCSLDMLISGTPRSLGSIHNSRWSLPT